MPIYYYNGSEVDRGTALGIWLASETYKRAAYKDSIWPNAEIGSANPASTNHLREAGLRIERDDLRHNPQ